MSGGTADQGTNFGPYQRHDAAAAVVSTCIQTAKKTYGEITMPGMDVRELLQVSRPTLCRWLAKQSAVARARLSKP